MIVLIFFESMTNFIKFIARYEGGSKIGECKDGLHNQIDYRSISTALHMQCKTFLQLGRCIFTIVIQESNQCYKKGQVRFS
jgi:hypothetical protein